METSTLLDKRTRLVLQSGLFIPERLVGQSQAREDAAVADPKTQRRAWEIAQISRRRYNQGLDLPEQINLLQAARDKRARRRERNLRNKKAAQ